MATSLGELRGFLEAVRDDDVLKRWDTGELIDFMLASGRQVAEVCGLEASSVDFDAGTATVEAMAVRVNSRGAIRQPLAKTE
ncbi:hypothetical protein [Demequina sp. NBRC 110052]|uniref:hypothetical protein n=1 Tax=Demequina sp. NBRC 110052 TaxID=1570341 RepID=UPI000A0759CE|nr:hypothetical protein [Demequina sp. NBRC 110052]